VMGEALSCALAQLRLYGRNDRIVELVARRIVRAALQGERDPEKLYDIAVDDAGDATAA
jgi:hypothetical protein